MAGAGGWPGSGRGAHLGPDPLAGHRSRGEDAAPAAEGESE